MSPFFFGQSSRRLFGLYTPARAVGGKQRGIVLCHPWGQEYLRAHRSMCRLGNMLADTGHHVLRFDYFGTGDSAGDMTEASLAGWQSDVQTAIDELKDMAGLNRVSLLGLRLGATLAAQAAAQRRKDVDAVVLWDPVVSGRDYLAELCETDEQVLPRAAQAGGGLELLGFPMIDALTRQVAALDLASHVAGLPARSVVVVSAPLPSHTGLRAALQQAGDGRIFLEAVAGLPAWLEDRDSGAGAVPVRVLQRIVEWLG